MAEKKTTRKRIMKGKGKYARIKNNQERAKSNLKHVLQSSGIEAAKGYAASPKVMLGSYLVRLMNKKAETARPNRNAHKARRPLAERRK